MIENFIQYSTTKSQLNNLERALKVVKEKRSTNIHRRLEQAMIEGIQSLIDELEFELVEFRKKKAPEGVDFTTEECWLCGGSNPDISIKVNCETPGGKECPEKLVMIHFRCYVDMES